MGMAPEASSQGKKHPLDAEDKVVELLDQDQASQEKEEEKEQR